MSRTFRAELIERTHDDRGVKLAPGHMVVRMTIGVETFDLPMGFAVDLAALIVHWDSGAKRTEVFTIVQASGFGTPSVDP